MINNDKSLKFCSMDTDFDEQENEVLALQAIFSEEEYLKFNSVKQPETSQDGAECSDSLSGASCSQRELLLTCGDFSAHIQLSDSFYIKDFQGDQPTANIAHLPPIVLGFELPPTYPHKDPPKINLSCKWLSPKQLSRLVTHLDEISEANKGEPILYIWFDFLQQDSMKLLDLEECLVIQPSEKHSKEVVDQRVVQDIASNSILFHFLVEYNKDEKQRMFEKSTCLCKICYEEKLGIDSFQFHGCSHSFCKECIAQHFTVRIESGEVKQLTCPEGGCDSQGHPSQIKELLSSDLYERYERLLLQCTLDTMLDITYCPRSFCQTAVILDPGSTLAACSGCQYVFCNLCKMSYHGIHPCRLRKDELKEKLDEASEEDLEAFKARYGKQLVENLINESASYAWVDEYAKHCPVCKAAITKIDGCNKMTCTKCKAYFCWLCRAILSRGDPYSHFRNSLECNLFPGEELEGLNDSDSDSDFDPFDFGIP
ncbi:RNF14 [Bugula neritina]|uniref:RBR-type E3 ubiquitin transferase n=1 Tax=Bugula neritina TaxID=10212 RepID=A0A7J7IWI8_BUGNE|nr:RNF14 [Bugula neritina]